MNYCYTVPERRGTCIKSYVAKIVGEHSVYGFDRKFLRRTIYGYSDHREYQYRLGDHGVFERRIMRRDKATDKLLECERSWFLLCRGRIYPIEKSDVLFALFNLNQQYKTAG